MEVCCGAYHLARQFVIGGYEVRLLPEYVKPYLKSYKNDDRDAEAIAEAAIRPTMRFVPIKSEEQLDRGIVIAKGRPKLNLWLRENLRTIRS